METGLKRLPLHFLHAERGAHFGAFGEWEVPLYFTSIFEEHEAVRTRAGLFDISHMGEFYLSGKDAKTFLDRLLPRKAERLRDGKAFYTSLLNDQGGMIDDVIVYQIHPERFLFVVNAANIEKDFRWIKHLLPQGLQFENASDRLSLFALQGPQSMEIAAALFHCDFKTLGYYHFLYSKTPWGEVLISRTGYTGEDGIEIMGEIGQAASLWEALLDAGRSHELQPIGFGARDTLRLEAGMLLYGQDMDDSTSPLEAGLEWTVDFEKEDFVGRERLVHEKKEGVKRRLVGFELLERGIPRRGFAIEKAGCLLGEVTSGTFAPSLQKNIGLGYVSTRIAETGNEFDIVIRGKCLKARVCELPFYRRRPQ